MVQDNAGGGQRPIRRITLCALTSRNPQETDAAVVAGGTVALCPGGWCVVRRKIIIVASQADAYS